MIQTFCHPKQEKNRQSGSQSFKIKAALALNRWHLHKSRHLILNIRLQLKTYHIKH